MVYGRYFGPAHSGFINQVMPTPAGLINCGGSLQIVICMATQIVPSPLNSLGVRPESVRRAPETCRKTPLASILEWSSRHLWSVVPRVAKPTRAESRWTRTQHGEIDIFPGEPRNLQLSRDKKGRKPCDG